MNIRPVREEDIEQVIQLFRLNYGDNYAIPEFYDPQWVKRGIYSDHIIWMVIEEAGKVVASGAAILDFGDYNDQIAEIGRLVVDPESGGKGLGRTLLNALVDASDDRVDFAFGEARTTHIKTQRIFDRVGLMPLGFLPMAYTIQWRESWVLSGQLFGHARRLRQPESLQIIPCVAPIAELSLRNLELEPIINLYPDARSYPLEGNLHTEPLSGTALVRLLKIEQGRLVDPEVFGGLHIDQGYSQLLAHKAIYLVANECGDTLGAVGYMIEESSRRVRIIELIARDDLVKGNLIRQAVEEAEQQHQAEVIDCDVSAHNPRIQQTLFELGFLPVAYVPGMVFHNTSRWDVVKMMKVNVPWNLGAIELTESSKAMYDIVTPPFIARDEARQRKHPARSAVVLKGLTSLEVDFVEHAGEERSCSPGEALEVDGLYIVLEGSVKSGEHSFGPGESLGSTSLLRRRPELTSVADSPTRLLHLSLQSFDALCDRHPRLGLKLYRNFGV